MRFRFPWPPCNYCSMHSLQISALHLALATPHGASPGMNCLLLHQMCTLAACMAYPGVPASNTSQVLVKDRNTAQK